MKKSHLVWVFLGATMLAGCATGGRNYQTDIDAMNARITALQGQLAAKDQEIHALEGQVADQRMARDAAEAALASAQNEHRSLSEQLENAKRKPAPTPVSKTYASDLK